jgi:hypothetical protein
LISAFLRHNAKILEAEHGSVSAEIVVVLVLLWRFQENCSRRRKEADTLTTLPPRYLGGYDFF